MLVSRALPFVLLPLLSIESFADEIERIWLTHQTNDPSKLVVNWQTDEPGDSVVEFGTTTTLSERATREELVTLHHVEIPLAQKDVRYRYRVRTGAQTSAVHQFKSYPSNELRVAVVADTGYTKQAWAPGVQRDDPHLLLSAGDHVPALHSGQPVARENTGAFSDFVSQSPELFQSTPWLAALGNHDREIRPRGPKPPPEPVYDIEATAFREFFALPGEEWHWHFDVPDFGVRFVALDLSHLSDMGTTWQTCHRYARDAPYADPKSAVLKSEDNFVLLTFRREPPLLRIELKNLSGDVLDLKEFSPRRADLETKQP